MDRAWGGAARERGQEEKIEIGNVWNVRKKMSETKREMGNVGNVRKKMSGTQMVELQYLKAKRGMKENKQKKFI